MDVSVVMIANEHWLIQTDLYGNFLIKSETISALMSYRQLGSKDTESGGALVGYIRADNTLEAYDLTHPQSTDRRTRTSFFRSSAHNRILNEKWRASNGASYLVGLWHTHPEPVPNYSSKDKKDWLKVLKQGQYEGKHLMFLIVGQAKIRMWIADNESYETSLVGEFSFEE